MAGLAGDLRGGAASSSKSKTEFARVRIRNLHDKVCNERVRDGDGDATLFFAVQESGCGVRRAKAALSSGCKTHPATAPAGSNRSSYGGNEMAEAFVAPGKVQERGTKM